MSPFQDAYRGGGSGGSEVDHPPTDEPRPATEELLARARWSRPALHSKLRMGTADAMTAGGVGAVGSPHVRRATLIGHCQTGGSSFGRGNPCRGKSTFDGKDVIIRPALWRKKVLRNRARGESLTGARRLDQPSPHIHRKRFRGRGRGAERQRSTTTRTPVEQLRVWAGA